MARTFLLVAAALVGGMLVGALSPRGELLRARAEVEALRGDARACKRGAASAGIAQIFGGARPGNADPGGSRPGEPAGKGAAAANGPGADAPPATGEVAPGEASARGSLPESPEALGEALDARAAQARAALIEQVEPTAEELAAIDAAIDRMNQRLQAQVDALADALQTGEEPERRELLEFGAEALDAVIEADDAISAVIPPEARDDLDPEVLDPFAFIDGETVAGLAALGEAQ